MPETKTDPRILRTRRLIMDAFLQISMKKDFKDITIKDITAEATVNRATFYYHFLDKYDLAERVLKEDLMVHVIHEIHEHRDINEEAITSVFLAVTGFQSLLSAQCRRNYLTFLTMIEALIKKELENTFFDIFSRQHPSHNKESLRIAAATLSWGIYGATVDWQHNSSLQAEEYIKLAMPYILHGINWL
ncbi:TetR/AcrR family transcriptional regulator [Paenibacillus jiagnxiensis]|uniref:TetR/AcrR family transcriptional regulator n=1 Tax=Paenibacillus jiagnxiensis TaxID=3228926 RepID=UPI00348891D1